MSTGPSRPNGSTIPAGPRGSAPAGDLSHCRSQRTRPFKFLIIQLRWRAACSCCSHYYCGSSQPMPGCRWTSLLQILSGWWSCIIFLPFRPCTLAEPPLPQRVRRGRPAPPEPRPAGPDGNSRPASCLPFVHLHPPILPALLLLGCSLLLPAASSACTTSVAVPSEPAEHPYFLNSCCLLPTSPSVHSCRSLPARDGTAPPVSPPSTRRGAGNSCILLHSILGPQPGPLPSISLLPLAALPGAPLVSLHPLQASVQTTPAWPHPPARALPGCEHKSCILSDFFSVWR